MSDPTPAPSNGPSRRNRRVLVVIASVLVLAALAVLISVWVAATQDDRAYARAASLLEQGTYAEAERAYLTFGLAYPGSPFIAQAEADLPKLYLAWAHALAEHGDYDLSTYKFEKVLDAFPDTAEAGEAEGSIVDVGIAWSKALCAQGDFAKAEQVLGPTVQRDPASPELKSQMAEVALGWGQALAAAGDYGSALNKLRAALEAFSETAASGKIESAYLDAAIGLGKDFLVQGRFAEAQEVLEEAAALVPGDKLDSEMLALHLGWIRALLDSGEMEKGIAKIVDLADRWPDSAAVQELSARLPDLYLRWADDLALALPGSFGAALEIYQRVAEQYAGSPAALEVEPRLFTLYMSYGRSQISAAEQATREPNQEATCAALKRALGAFQQALKITPGTEEAAQWVSRIGAINPATAPVFVVAPGSQVNVVITLPPNPPIKQQLDYRKSRVNVLAEVWDYVVEASLLASRAEWSDMSDQLAPVIYTVTLSVGADVAGGAYRQLLDSGLYWRYYTPSYSTPSRTVGELIQRQGCAFYVIVP